MVGEKPTIQKTNENYLIVEDNLIILSKINHIILKNELEELAINILRRNMTNSSLKFFINKQAAFNNTFHMIDENMSTLGDIEVTIESDYPEKVIEWITS